VISIGAMTEKDRTPATVQSYAMSAGPLAREESGDETAKTELRRRTNKLNNIQSEGQVVQIVV
jgi:hypothetical protein